MAIPSVIPEYYDTFPSFLNWFSKRPANKALFFKLFRELQDLRNSSFSREFDSYDLKDLELMKLWDDHSLDQVMSSGLPMIVADAILATGDDEFAFDARNWLRAVDVRRHDEWRSKTCGLSDSYFRPHILDAKLNLGLSVWNEAKMDLLISVERKYAKIYEREYTKMLENFKALLKAVLLDAEEVVWKNVVAVARTFVGEVEGGLSKIQTEKDFVEIEVHRNFKEVEEEVRAEEEVATELLYTVVVSAASLLLFVYQYLIGYIDKGGTLTCSSGSFQFRVTYISIVLFEGAYVWIKFRDVASPSTRGGGYRRPRKNKLSGTIKLSKPEARYTPPGQAGNNLYLGVCDTDHEAQIKKKIAAFYYGRDEGKLELGDGRSFQIPSMSVEQEQGLSVPEKRKWVRDKVREVYKEFETERATLASDVHDVDQQINPSHFETNGSEEGSLIPSEDPPDAFDSDFGTEDQDFTPEMSPLRDLPGAQTQQPAEVDADAFMGNGNAELDSMASTFPPVSSIPSPKQGSDAEAVLMDMLRDSEQKGTELQQEVTELRQVVNDKDVSLQECWQKLEAMKQILEVRDRRVSELELELLCRRRTSE